MGRAAQNRRNAVSAAGGMIFSRMPRHQQIRIGKRLPKSVACHAGVAWHARRCAAWLLALTFGAMIAGPGRAEDKPLRLEEIAPGVHVHIGAIALMSAANEGATANIGVVIGDAAVAVTSYSRWSLV